jgi:hypothetical protein
MAVMTKVAVTCTCPRSPEIGLVSGLRIGEGIEASCVLVHVHFDLLTLESSLTTFETQAPPTERHHTMFLHQYAWKLRRREPLRGLLLLWKELTHQTFVMDRLCTSSSIS